MPPNAQPVVEPATPDDLDYLADCWVSLAREQRAHGSHIQADANRATIRTILAGHLSTDGLLVARLEGEIVGFASFSVERGSFELDASRALLSNLWVDPDYRNREIGGELLESVERTLRDRGVKICKLETMVGNDAGRRFYRRHGYERSRIAMERRLDEGRKNDTHSKDDA